MSNITYIAVVAAMGGVVLVIALNWLQRLANRRLERLRSRKLEAPVATTSPVEKPREVARRFAVESIGRQFTVSRRVLIPFLVFTTICLAALPFLSVAPAGVMSLFVAVVSVLLGVAGRPIVENVFAGLTISQSRLLNLGDTVMLDGHYGTVEDITLTHTVVKIWDWRRHVIPNSAMLNMHFVNYSLYDSYVWVHVEFTISQDSDLEKVKQLALASPSSSVYLAKHEDPRFWIRDVSGPCIRCWVAAWADSPADAWMLAHDMRTNIVESFQREGIRTEVVLHRLVENPKNHPVLQDSPESTTARVNAASDYVATNPTSQQPWQSPMDPAADHRWQSSVDTVAAAEAAAQG